MKGVTGSRSTTSSERYKRVSHVTRPIPAPTSSARIRFVRVTDPGLGLKADWTVDSDG